MRLEALPGVATHAVTRKVMNPEIGELLVNEVSPRLRSLSSSFNGIGSEDREELCQDAIAMSARLLVSSQKRGKCVTPGNVAYYAAGLVRQGRRSTGERKTDPLHPAAQIRGQVKVVSLEAALTDKAEGEEPMCLHDALASPVEDPGMVAGRRLDWAQVLQNLDQATMRILICLLIGEPLTCLARRLKRSRSALQQDKERLARVIREHLGDEILQQVQEAPRWRDNLFAWREKGASRAEKPAGG